VNYNNTVKTTMKNAMFSLLPLVSLHWGITNCSFYCLGSLLSSNTPHSEMKSSSFRFSYKAFGLLCQKKKMDSYFQKHISLRAS